MPVAASTKAPPGRTRIQASRDDDIEGHIRPGGAVAKAFTPEDVVEFVKKRLGGAPPILSSVR